MDEAGFSKDDKFVDIHGREIPTFVVGKQEEIALSLADLKKTGVGIYQKTQYAKLSKMNKQFDSTFVDYMLESAKTYMLDNKVFFNQEQIMNSIEKCKTILMNDNENLKPQQEDNFFKERSLAKSNDDNIRIEVANTPSPPKKQTVQPKLEAIKPIKEKSLSPKDVKSEKKVTFANANDNSGNSNGAFKKLNNGLDNKKQEDSKPIKKHSYNISQVPVEVLVTKIDKPNCIWVRDKANDEIFANIHSKVNEEVKYQKTVSKPCFNTVYLAQDEGFWFRCKLIKSSPLTVFFLDYGNIAEVDEVREASEELSKFPCMAVRVTFKASEYNPVLEDEITIKCVFRNDDKTYFVNVLEAPKKNTSATFQESRNGIKESNFLLKESSQTVSPRTSRGFFKKPSSFCHLSNDQTVAIVQVQDEIFYLRTKECFAKLKDLENSIEEYAKDAKQIDSVKPNQLVLYHDQKSNKLKRAVVLKVYKRNIDIETFDYMERFTTSLNNLKTINEKLSEEPITCFPGGRLVGFENQQLDDNCKAIIAEHIQKRTKFQVNLGFDDELDLFNGSQLLSEQLKKAPKSPERIFLKDMISYEPQLGTNLYLCGDYKNSEDFFLVPGNLLKKHMDYIMRSEIEDEKVYTPVENEVCLCYYVDQWYRCAVIKVFKKECEVMLLDFGNIEMISKKDLRKPHDQFTKIPTLAVSCQLVDLPPHQDIETAMRKYLNIGEFYTADIKEVCNGKCYVKLPSVYQAINEQRLDKDQC